MNLGKRLKTARIRLGYTLREVERRSGKRISNAYLYQLENGNNTEPSPHILRALAKVLGLDYITLMMAAGYLSAKEIKAHTDNEQGLFE